ncbi:MAG: DUF3307 domain-containing protein [Longimicrobiales bacterium]
MIGAWLAGPLADATPAIWLLALLIGGHLLGDFLFQTGRMAAGKRRARTLAGHALVVTLVQLCALLPFLSRQVMIVVAGIGAVHAVIDAVKARRGHGLAVFLLDQAAHVLVLLGAWALLLRWNPAIATADAGWAGWTAPFVVAVIVAGAFAFVATGGSAIVSGTLAALSPTLEEREAQPGMKGSGRLIGILERTTTVVLIVLDQWAAIGLLLTAKSIARFEELKERDFAEYYLVGTLTSLLVAIVVGLLLTALIAAA